MDPVAKLPCLVSGEHGATLHHVTGYADRIGRLVRSHRLIVPLARRCHQAVADDASNPTSVERLNHRGFYIKYRIDLYASARKLEAESVAMGILPELQEAA